MTRKESFIKYYIQIKIFKKRLVANKSIIRRKKEHFELIEEIKSSYNKLPKSRTRREKNLFNQYAVLNVVGENKMINKDQINEAKPLVYTLVILVSNKSFFYQIINILIINKYIFSTNNYILIYHIF